MAVSICRTALSFTFGCLPQKGSYEVNVYKIYVVNRMLRMFVDVIPPVYTDTDRRCLCRLLTRTAHFTLICAGKTGVYCLCMIKGLKSRMTLTVSVWWST